MSRARSGNLELIDGWWFARVTVDLPDGKTERRRIPLETKDKAKAERLLKKLMAELAAGRLVAQAKADVTKPETFAGYVDGWLSKRDAQGVKMVKDERTLLKLHILPLLGSTPIADTRPPQIKAVLEAVAAKGRKRTTVGHVRALLHRIFRSAAEDELITYNPVTIVTSPKMREVKKERTILTDAELATFVSCPVVKPEIKMLVLVSRILGGMRSGDTSALLWSNFSADFTTCSVPRAKTAKPQRLDVPPVMQQILCSWWEAEGRPSPHKFVFPERRGPRKGLQKRARRSHAKRLREALLLAGCDRYELHNETPDSLPVDFHSAGRRGFASALAEAGTNAQHAARLSGHSTLSAHQRYTMDTAAMRVIPAAAVPQLNAGSMAHLANRKAESKNEGAFPIVRFSNDLSGGEGIRTPGQLAPSAVFKAGSQCALQPLYRSIRVTRGTREASCFPVRRHDLATVANCPDARSIAFEYDDEPIIEYPGSTHVEGEIPRVWS